MFLMNIASYQRPVWLAVEQLHRVVRHAGSSTEMVGTNIKDWHPVICFVINALFNTLFTFLYTEKENLQKLLNFATLIMWVV